MNTYFPTILSDNLLNVFDPFDRTFMRGLDRADRALYGKHGPHLMKTDVKETETAYELDVDLPGFAKDEIKLELNHGYLTIATEKSTEKENKDGRMVRQERYTGSMQRTFYIGDYVTEEDIRASLDSGVLHLTVPKKEAKKTPEKHQILIEG